ncbi:MAG: hypothetical protein IJA58_07865 [Lachnospiraceae bacterium]|nr:hypothetical protein [Lachnospiraceae bacterium]
MNEKLKWTLFEVWSGIALIGIVGVLLLGFITGFLSKETIGFAVGIIASMALFYSMSVSVENAFESGDGQMAKRSIKRSYLMRMVFITLGTFIAVRWNLFDVVVALLALFSIKVSVFFQPITHQLFCKWFKIKDEISPDALYLPEEEEEEDDWDDEDDEDKPDRIDRWMERFFGKR